MKKKAYRKILDNTQSGLDKKGKTASKGTGQGKPKAKKYASLL